MNNKNIVCKHLDKGFTCPYNKKCIVFDDKGKNLVFCHEIALILNPLFWAKQLILKIYWYDIISLIGYS